MASALLSAGLLSVVAFPPLALSLLRGGGNAEAQAAEPGRTRVASAP